MAAATVHLETELPTAAERVWTAMQHPASFLFVTRGLFSFPSLVGRTDPIREGEVGRGWVFAFNLIPAYRHTIEVVEVNDLTRTIRSHEYGGLLRQWDHTLHVEELSTTRCRYSDTLVIDAGGMTPAVLRIATGIFKYRQRRWRRLVQKHLLPEGPRYRLSSGAS